MWEKTVISNKKLQLLGQQYEDDIPTCDLNHYLLSAQAELTWDIAYKAGYEKRKSEAATVSLADMCMKHRKFGIQEVVEWIQAHSQLERCDPDVMTYFIDYLAVDYPDWQSKLEEWGIK